MDIRRLQQMLQNVERSGGIVRKVVRQDPSIVARVENMLGLEFPASVQLFYGEYEYLQVGPYEFVWIKVLPDLSKKLRAQQIIPDNYLPILPDGMGGYYFVLCSEKDKPEPEDYGSVVHNVGGLQKTFEFCNPDFLDFVGSIGEKVLREVDNNLFG